MVGRKVSEETRREDILRAAYDVAARQGLEALTLRAVAARADVSHGTVLFHFKRKHELVASLLNRVLYATAVLRIPDGVAQITRPSDRMHALLRAEMDRLSTDPRHFRLFLDYWTTGVRNTAIRQRIRVVLEEYRAAFRGVAAAVVTADRVIRRLRAQVHEVVPQAADNLFEGGVTEEHRVSRSYAVVFSSPLIRSLPRPPNTVSQPS